MLTLKECVLNYVARPGGRTGTDIISQWHLACEMERNTETRVHTSCRRNTTIHQLHCLTYIMNYRLLPLLPLI